MLLTNGYWNDYKPQMDVCQTPAYLFLDIDLLVQFFI